MHHQHEIEVDPVRYSYTPVVYFTHTGLRFEEGHVLSTQEKTKLITYANECIATYGLEYLARGKRLIECHNVHNICYLPTSLEAACSCADLKAVKTIFTDLSGHATADEQEEHHITMFFKKPVAGL